MRRTVLVSSAVLGVLFCVGTLVLKEQNATLETVHETKSEPPTDEEVRDIEERAEAYEPDYDPDPVSEDQDAEQHEILNKETAAATAANTELKPLAKNTVDLDFETRVNRNHDGSSNPTSPSNVAKGETSQAVEDASEALNKKFQHTEEAAEEFDSRSKLRVAIHQQDAKMDESVARQKVWNKKQAQKDAVAADKPEREQRNQRYDDVVNNRWSTKHPDEASPATGITQEEKARLEGRPPTTRAEEIEARAEAKTKDIIAKASHAAEKKVKDISAMNEIIKKAKAKVKTREETNAIVQKAQDAVERAKSTRDSTKNTQEAVDSASN